LHQLLEARDNLTQGYSRPPIIRQSLQHLATSFPTLVNQPDNASTYPLHAALQRLRRYEYRDAYVKFAEIETAIDDLLAAGADPHARDGRGNTALHYLADGLAERFMADEQRRLFRVFLGRGVDVNARNDTGRTAASVLFDDDGARTERQDGWYSFFELQGCVPSAEEFEEEVLGWFDEAGAQWDGRDRRGKTMMHVVVRHHTERAVDRFRFLMGKGLDVMAEDGERRTALDIAAACGNEGVLELYYGKAWQ
jgi:hypothetical protein